MSDGFVMTIAEASQTGEARRRVASLTSGLGFDTLDAGRVAIVVTEMATNLVKHAKRGDLLVRPLGCDGVKGVEVLALDRGPGISNVGQSLRDGRSTTGTAGTGLGAVMRLAQQFDIYSQVGTGTAVVAQLWARGIVDPSRRLEIGSVCVSYPGETECGDAWATEEQDRRSLVTVVDGLGHGVAAAEACREAVKAFRAHTAEPPPGILDAMHLALRSTRGASGAVAQVDWTRRVLRYSGVGNIAGAILTQAGDRHLVSHNGTLGRELRRVDEFTYAWPGDALLVLHSDGLGSRWDLARYPGLAERHPSLIAGVLYRDFWRGRDDVTVVTARGVPG